VVVGDKNLALTPSMVEVKHRAQKESRLMELAKAPEKLAGRVYGELEELNR
jgi:hypothetical protein